MPYIEIDLIYYVRELCCYLSDLYTLILIMRAQIRELMQMTPSNRENKQVHVNYLWCLSGFSEFKYFKVKHIHLTQRKATI